MQKSRVREVGALLVGLSLIAVACGGDDGATSATTAVPQTSTGAEEAGTDQGPCVGTSDGVLIIGTLLPVTGNLSSLASPQVAAVELAVADINGAGGVLGNDVVLHQEDAGDATTGLANQAVDRLLALGSDMILDSAASAVSFTVIDKITGSCVIQFSSAHTSPDFTTYDDGGLYFRTAPSDLLQGRVLADLVFGDGNSTTSVIYRQESYGIGLANSFRKNYEGAGGTVDEFISYAGDTDQFGTEIDALVEAGSDAIVIIGFSESAAIVTNMHERGIGPTDKAVYGVDGNISGLGSELADPSIIAGMKGTEPSADLRTITEFLDRLDAACPGGSCGSYAYGAETYDAIIIAALATIVAGTDDPTAIAANINDITRGPGTACTSFLECRDLLVAGEEVDYVGLGGPYEFIDAGEPSTASYRIAQYDGGATPNSELDEFVFAS